MPKGFGRPATKAQKASSDKAAVVKKMDRALKYRQDKAKFEADVIAPAIKQGRIKQGVRTLDAATIPEFKKGGLVKK